MTNKGWYDQALETLLRLSRALSFGEAMKEWKFTGEVKSHNKADQVCELCGKKNLRYRYRILNLKNGNGLFVGSDCIKKFEGITVCDEHGHEITDQKQKNAQLDKLKRELRKKASMLHPPQSQYSAEKPLLKNIAPAVARSNDSGENWARSQGDYYGWMDIHHMEFSPPCYMD